MRTRIKTSPRGARATLMNAVLGHEHGARLLPLARHRLRVDLVNVHGVTAAGLGLLVTLNKRARESGGRLSLHRVRPSVGEVLRLTRLDTIMDVRRVRASCVPC